MDVQIDHFWHRFLIDFCAPFQERPESGQEGPKSAQERPKSAPRAAKSVPRAAKSGQKVTKRSSRAAKSGQKVAKSGPCCRATRRTTDVTSRRHRPLGLYNRSTLATECFIVSCVPKTRCTYIVNPFERNRMNLVFLHCSLGLIITRKAYKP